MTIYKKRVSQNSAHIFESYIMNLDQLKEEARKDLIIENEEHLGSESLKNQKIKTKYLEGVIKSIDNRGWDIKNAIEWKKFEAGMI